MRVCLVNGSPREKSCTHTVLCEVEKGLRELGIDTEFFRLRNKPIADCIDCERYYGRHGNQYAWYLPMNAPFYGTNAELFLKKNRQKKGRRAAPIFDGGSGENSGSSTGAQQAIAAGEYLTIPTAEISATASFYPITVNGTEMEVFAIKASDGTIRTAFNTCQGCYTSGRGCYVQQGSDLVCRSCGFQFTPDQVEIQSGGCNPWPIFAENKTATEDSIQISYSFLKESSSIFANWKRA